MPPPSSRGAESACSTASSYSRSGRPGTGAAGGELGIVVVTVGTWIDSCATARASSSSSRQGCATVADAPPPWGCAPAERRQARILGPRLRADAPPSQMRRRGASSPLPRADALGTRSGRAPSPRGRDAPLAARARLRRHLHARMRPVQAPPSFCLVSTCQLRGEGWWGPHVS